MRINKKERLQTAVDKLEDTYDKVSDDLYSLIQNNNISKSYIAKDIDIFKNQLQYVEKILKIYQEVQIIKYDKDGNYKQALKEKAQELMFKIRPFAR